MTKRFDPKEVTDIADQAMEIVKEMTTPNLRKERAAKGKRVTKALGLAPQDTVDEAQLAAEKKKQVKKTDDKGRFAKGCNTNPHGRKGSDGRGGFLFRTGFTAFTDQLTEVERIGMWHNMFQKAASGDVQAFKFLTQFNKELESSASVAVEADTGVRVSITLPPKEDN